MEVEAFARKPPSQAWNSAGELIDVVEIAHGLFGRLHLEPVLGRGKQRCPFCDSMLPV
jgi:hypothetical protein